MSSFVVDVVYAKGKVVTFKQQVVDGEIQDFRGITARKRLGKRLTPSGARFVKIVFK